MRTKREALEAIIRNKEKIKEYGVRHIGIFGSFVKSRQKHKSDVDVLVEFKAEDKTFDNYMELKFFLQNLLKRKVDLVIKDALKTKIKPYIMKEVEYARL